MDTSTRNTIIIVIAALILLGTAGYFFSGNFIASADKRAIRALVANFGIHLQKVSLLGPDASSTVATEYSPYVAPELLAVWQKDPVYAPGRRASSPWPDHIEIDSITPAVNDQYTVSAKIIMMTSNEVAHGGNAGTVPILIQLGKVSGNWEIIGFTRTQ